MAKEKDEKKKTKRPTAQKREIQNEKKRMRNRIYRSQVRTAVRSFKESLDKKDKEILQEKLNTVYSLLDKAVQRGLIKKNNASRAKARLTAKLHAV